ncbi:MAG: ribonuclease Z [Clostridia bacterium]|nr:ribonuclease Z [Clostridia bacterium]
MKIIVCVDKKNGMLFNSRRQSQDEEIRNRIIGISKDSTLWMNDYSAKQFNNTDNIRISESFLNEAQNGDYCFVENCEIIPDRIESVILYKWNRNYPADMFFEIDLKKLFKKISSTDFAGSSHEKITEEIYIRK